MKQAHFFRNATATLNRRSFIKAGAAALGASALGNTFLRSALAQDASVVAIMPGVFMPDDGRPIIEKMSGVKVENAPYVSPTDTLAKLLAPGGTERYDMMVSTTNFVKGPALGEKAGDEKVAALDMSQIPNAANLMPLFKNDIVMRDGQTYMIPVVWGYDSILYNRDHIADDDEVTQTWGLVFDDRYAGKVALRDDAHQMITITALHLGHEDPNAMQQSDLDEVIKFLISKKKNFRTLWSAFGEAVNLMSSGEVWAMYGWIAMRAALQRQGHNVTNNWPSNGIFVWNQSAFIPKDSPNKDHTHRVINAMLSKEFGQKLTEVTNYPSTSAEAAGLFSAEDQRRYGFDVVDRGLRIYPFDFPPTLDRWIEAWGKFKAA